MKCIRPYLGFIVTILMCGICLTAVGISIRVTNIFFERKYQAVKSTSAQENRPENCSNAQVNISKISDMELFLNGQKIQDLNSYSTDKKQWLVPLDQILEKAGYSLKHFSPDDIYEASLQNNKLV